MTVFVEHFRELFQHRALVGALVWRDLKARYRGSVLGYFWTLLNPLLLLAVYHLVFTKYTRGVDLEHYAVFLFVGILPWLWLSSSVTVGAGSIVGGASLITRVCIPPQVLPAVTVASTTVNFLLALPLALVAAAAYGISPSAAFLLLPLLILLELAFLYALTLGLATATVRFRDVGFLVQSLLTIWFFMTPVAYPFSAVPESYRSLLVANPATAIVLPFQDAIFFRRLPDPRLVGLAAAWSAGLLVLAVRYFESARDTLAEEI